jgi:hypothetical protein
MLESVKLSHWKRRFFVVEGLEVLGPLVDQISFSTAMKDWL